jgi:hypothetical protein
MVNGVIMFNKISRLMMVSAMVALLLGCGSDSQESSDDVAYVQCYNASPNSTSTSLVLDDYSYTAVDFADAMPRYACSPGSTELEIYGQDEDSETVTVYSDTVNLAADSNYLFVLYDDYHDPEHFVRASETIETAEYTLTDLDFVEQLSLTLPEDYYEINIVYQADNGT